MKFDFKVTASVDETDDYGCRVKEKVGLYRTSATNESLGDAIVDIVRFAAMAHRNIEPSQVISRLATAFGEESDVYETAAERAAKAACVVLMHGVDCRINQLQKTVERLAEGVAK